MSRNISGHFVLMTMPPIKKLQRALLLFDIFTVGLASDIFTKLKKLHGFIYKKASGQPFGGIFGPGTRVKENVECPRTCGIGNRGYYWRRFVFYYGYGCCKLRRFCHYHIVYSCSAWMCLCRSVLCRICVNDPGGR